MYTDTEIANLALSHLGQGLEIADLETESGPEARALRAFWAIARRRALRDFNWPFASKFVALGLVEENPNDEWGFSYQYPSDCVYFRRILSGSRVDTESSKVPYRTAYGASGQVIYTDQREAQAEYTKDVSETARWPDDFVMAHSYLVAHYIAPRVARDDGNALASRALELYVFELSKAQAAAMNEQGREQDPDAELIRARD